MHIFNDQSVLGQKMVNRRKCPSLVFFVIKCERLLRNISHEDLSAGDFRLEPGRLYLQ